MRKIASPSFMQNRDLASHEVGAMGTEGVEPSGVSETDSLSSKEPPVDVDGAQMKRKAKAKGRGRSPKI